MIQRISSELLILLSFIGLILVGTGLLLLPMSTTAGSLSVLDAVFTSTSAACVTGLVLLDTGSDFTFFGQAVILAVIQLGGLGIITLSTFFAILLGKKMPLKQREVVRQTHSTLDTRDFTRLVRRIVFFTLSFEAIGALLLFLEWRKDFDILEGIWVSVFHSVSAFCNAGFSLFPDSLSRYHADLGVNLIVIVLITLGGLGFFVIYDLERFLIYRKRLSLHSNLVLRTSVFLVVAGTVMFFMLEYKNVLSGHTLYEKLIISLFQSVTARTAGFNTIEIGDLTNSSLVFLMFLMFVGGSPGSTAGGIKTTALALLLATAHSRFIGRNTTNVLNRTVPEKTISQMNTVLLLSLVLLFFFYFTLQWSETGSVPHKTVAGSLMETSFEAVSAYGTVGLSAGQTAKLSPWGKMQIIALMFLGRVGPLAVAIAIGRQYQRRIHYEFYKENVMVG